MDIVTVAVIAQSQEGESLKPSNPNIKRRKEELLSRYGSPHLKSQQRQLDFCELQARLLYTVSFRDTDVERSCPPKTKQNKTNNNKKSRNFWWNEHKQQQQQVSRGLKHWNKTNKRRHKDYTRPQLQFLLFLDNYVDKKIFDVYDVCKLTLTALVLWFSKKGSSTHTECAIIETTLTELLQWELGQLLPQVRRNTQNTSPSCCLPSPKDNFSLYFVGLSRVLYQYSILQFKEAQTGRSLLTPTPHDLSWPGVILGLCLLYSSPV